MNLLKSDQKILPRHFYSLDVLRGLAALAIVFWHWGHFFYIGPVMGPFDPLRQPLYQIFQPFYLFGFLAVDLFFCLSGFIFFWLYKERISNLTVSGKEFFVLRFSRLYPLHFFTLIVVLVEQWLLHWKSGSFYVYPHNDLFHFVLQLLFVSNWGLDKGWSFNGPAWSVSVEVFCYVVFFLICRIGLTRIWHIFAFILCGYVMQSVCSSLLGKGVFSFFIGGLTFEVFYRIAKQKVGGCSLVWLTVLAGLLWIIIPMNARGEIAYHIYKTHFWSESLNFMGRDYIGGAIRKVSFLSFEVILFPVTIFTLALLEARRGTLGRRFAVVGHISYSSYLIHFPLQLFFVGAALWLAIPTSFFYTPLSLALFFGVLLLLSLLSYRYLERPCQSLIRNWVLSRKMSQ